MKNRTILVAVAAFLVIAVIVYRIFDNESLFSDIFAMTTVIYAGIVWVTDPDVKDNINIDEFD